MNCVAHFPDNPTRLANRAGNSDSCIDMLITYNDVICKNISTFHSMTKDYSDHLGVFATIYSTIKNKNQTYKEIIKWNF